MNWGNITHGWQGQQPAFAGVVMSQVPAQLASLTLGRDGGVIPFVNTHVLGSDARPQPGFAPWPS